MPNEFAKQWTDFGASAFESLKALNEINTKTTEKLAAQQLQFANSSVESGIKQVTLFAETKGYKDLFSGQAGLASEYNQMVVDSMRETADALNESKSELSAWFEKGAEAYGPSFLSHMQSPTKKPTTAKAATKKAA